MFISSSPKILYTIRINCSLALTCRTCFVTIQTLVIIPKFLILPIISSYRFALCSISIWTTWHACLCLVNRLQEIIIKSSFKSSIITERVIAPTRWAEIWIRTQACVTRIITSENRPLIISKILINRN